MALRLLAGNTTLAKWTANSLRRAGLCENHFDPSSFKEGPTKKKNFKTLKRDVVPVKFNGYSQHELETKNTGTNQNLTLPAEIDINNDTEIVSQEIITDNVEINFNNDTEIVSQTINNDNVKINVPNYRYIKTYQRAKEMYFYSSDEEENVSE
ncbi:uncharacterized protein LOC120359619 [Solenopsis invicta]|uniref:uncharacterized protein LOC120359619 n=1 Tax=Solenopsis invicta TaxID=13686 RepID=UPI00193DB2AA|nr:uncharacterized protein LOC120359619 [Solenopsis invicta]XP_039313623.1 uncharacterized protein LOC120359619 [Solenopsis invicta]